MGPVERVMVERVAADPVTAVLAEVVGGVVRDVLTEHLPELTLSRAEAAGMLGVSTKTVDRLSAAGELTVLVPGRITLASVLALAGWTVAPAPLAAPLAVVPA